MSISALLHLASSATVLMPWLISNSLHRPSETTSYGRWLPILTLTRVWGFPCDATTTPKNCAINRGLSYRVLANAVRTYRRPDVGNLYHTEQQISQSREAFSLGDNTMTTQVSTRPEAATQAEASPNMSTEKIPQGQPSSEALIVADWTSKAEAHLRRK